MATTTASTDRFASARSHFEAFEAQKKAETRRAEFVRWHAWVKRTSGPDLYAKGGCNTYGAKF